MDALVLIGSFCILCAIGVPIAFSLGLSSLIGAFWVDLPAEAIMLKISDGTDDFSLLAIPFFVLAGAIMAEGGMAVRLINLAKVLVGWIRGGLAVVNIFASTLFGTISGSSVADTASIGSIMIPQMVKQGYPRVFSVNLTICGSVQAVLIPPSHNAVIYSIAAGGTVSIAHLFLAGILPGILFGLCLVGLVLWTAQKRHMPKAEILSLRESLKVAADSFWGLGTVFIILGGILSGIFTATESAAIACVYAFIVTMFIYRDYKWSQLPRLVHRTVKTVAMVMLLIGVSAAFGYMMAIMQVPAKATALFLELTNNKYVMLMMINVLLLLLGTFMDMAPMLLICTPILLPVMKTFGVDPVHFGLVFIVAATIGNFTPPVGAAMYAVCSILKAPVGAYTRESLPFLLAVTLVTLLLVFVPDVVLLVPDAIFGKD